MPENHSCAMWVRHTWKCRLPRPLTLSESCIFCVNNTTQKWNFALDEYITRSALVHHRWRHFAQWGLFQAGNTVTYRALTKPCAHCCPFHDSIVTVHGTPGPLWIVITASACGQALHVLKISFRKLSNGSVGGWQEQCRYRMNPPAQGAGQVWAATGWCYYGGWHARPLRGLHVLRAKDSLIQTRLIKHLIHLCTYKKTSKTKTEFRAHRITSI